MFHAWECISLFIDSTRTSVDFVVKDSTDMMCLLHVIRHGLSKVRRNCIPLRVDKGPLIGDCCLSYYRVLKFKMKLSYMARVKDTSWTDLFQQAVQKTLVERRIMSVFKLQKIAAQHLEQKILKPYVPVHDSNPFAVTAFQDNDCEFFHTSRPDKNLINI